MERDLTVNDIIHLLLNGHVLEEGQPTTKQGIVGETPDSGARGIAAIVVPSIKFSDIKILDVMWRDEAGARGGVYDE